MSETESPIISLRELTKRFQSGEESILVLNSLTMDFAAGKKVIVTGESGSGKSTLLHLIAGLESVTSGSIEVAGERVDRMKERQLALFRRKTIGLVFQSHYLLKDFTAMENILLPAEMIGTPHKEAKRKAMQLIEAVGLTHRIRHYPAQLSGGERQRVAVARALINNPELVLADEPTGNLDPANAFAVSQLLFQMVDDARKSLLLVTHDQGLKGQGDLHCHLREGILKEEAEA